MLSAVSIFESAPEFSKKIFLDFDGHVVQNSQDTHWTKNNGFQDIHAPAYDIDGDPSTFSLDEMRNIEEAWRRVAEDFAPFQVDVTTKEPSAAVLAAGGQGIRVIVSSRTDTATGNQWWDLSFGGVADFDSWNYAGDRPAWVFANDFHLRPDPFLPHFIGTIASHELGHSFDLDHDGNTSEPVGSEDYTYYVGHGGGETSWGPIMGGAEHQNLTQWSNGDYSVANQTEDDLAEIASRLNFRADDYGNVTTVGGSELLTIADGLFSASGIIGGSTGTTNGNDLDVFRFDVGMTPIDVTINVDPEAVGPNLDILLNIYDADDLVTPIATINPTDALDAAFSFIGSGEYFLEIDGIGKAATPTDDGYSDYGSLGRYTISGTAGAPRVTNLIAQSTYNTPLWGDFSFDTVDGDGNQIKKVPLGAIDQLLVVFSEDVGTVTGADFVLTGLRTGVTPGFTVAYDAPAKTATLNLTTPLATDQYLLSVRDTITDAASNALDGNWINPAFRFAYWFGSGTEPSTFPSGDDVAGGDFNFGFTILPGDLNVDNVLDQNDQDTFDSLYESPSQPVTSALETLLDFDRNGVIDAVDKTAYANQVAVGWSLRFLTAAGDFDEDPNVLGVVTTHAVNEEDLDIFIDHWLQSVDPYEDGDANGDGFVDLADWAILAPQLGIEFDTVMGFIGAIR